MVSLLDRGRQANVADYYCQVQILPHIVAALRQMLTDQFDDLHAAAKVTEARKRKAAESLGELLT